jgi:hypothetical protein
MSTKASPASRAGGTFIRIVGYEITEVKQMNEDTCKWVEGPAKSECGKPAKRKILLGGVTGSARVPVCLEHSAEHHRKAAEKRAVKK